MVPMRDGIRMATDIYRPARDGRPLADRRPVLLHRTPYNKVETEATSGQCRFFASRGYVVVNQDCRGCFGSEGDVNFLIPEAEDGADTIAWIRKQEWCDGTVGTFGTSWSGWTQTAMAALGPEGLATMVPNMSGADGHESSVRHGGALELRFLAWAFWHSAYNTQAALTAPPHVQAALNQGAPRFSDWLERMPIRPGQTQLALVPPYEKWALEILTRADYDDYWKHPSVDFRRHWDRVPDMPILLVGGWYDSYTRATFQNFVGLGAGGRRPVRALMGPWTHGGQDHGALLRRRRGVRPRRRAAELRRAAPALVRPVAARRGQRPRRRGPAAPLRDGRRLGPALGRGPPRARRPLARRARVAAGPHALHRLLPARRRVADDGAAARGAAPPPPTGSTRPAPCRPSAATSRPCATCCRCPPASRTRATPAAPSARWTSCARAASTSARPPASTAAARPTCRWAPGPTCWCSRPSPCVEPIEVTGPIEVHLWVATSAVDTDFTAKLIDVYPPSAWYPQGYALNLTDSIARLRYRNGRERGELVKPGEPVQVTITLYPTSNLFMPGHRIRLDVSSSNFPRFDVNPNTGEAIGRERRRVVADNTVFHERGRESRVVLPVIPVEPALG